MNLRRYPSNHSFEVIYQAMVDDDCYSATEMSRLIQRFTPEQFGRITFEQPLVLAEGKQYLFAAFKKIPMILPK